MVAAISGGNISCWPISTSIFQSRAMASCPASGLVGGLLNFSCPWSLDEGSGRYGTGCSQGQGVGGNPLVFKSCCQTLEDLVVPSGVAALCEAGLTIGQDLFESHWSCAEGTGWILTIPLMEVFWRWKHIIGGSDDEADVACLHFSEHPPAKLSPLQVFPPHPLSLLGKRDGLCISFRLLLTVHLLHHHFPPL